MLCSQHCVLYVDFVPKITARNEAYVNDGTKMVQSGHRDLTTELYYIYLEIGLLYFRQSKKCGQKHGGR